MDNEKRYEKVRIDGYGADGHVKRSVSNHLDAPVIRVMMQEMLHEGLVPVIRDVGMPWEGKADETREGKPAENMSVRDARVTEEPLSRPLFKGVHSQLLEARQKKGLSVEDLPMVLEWTCGEIKFRAAGKGEDVLDAQGDFMEELGYMLKVEEEPVMLTGWDGETKE